MSGGPTSARSDRQDLPQVDVEDRAPRHVAVADEQAGEAAWNPAPVLRARRRRRDRTGTLVALTLVAIAVAAIKPWGVAAPTATAPAAAGVTVVVPPGSTAPQPTPGPVIADRNAMTCLTHQGEQVLTLERWPDREIKSWSQPDGPAVVISSTHVVGIGVCPGTGPVASAPAAAEPSRDPVAWAGAVLTDVRVLDGGNGHDLGRPSRITEQVDYVAAGVLYGPPPSDRTTGTTPEPSATGPASRLGAAAELPAWPAGRYQISYFFPGDPETVVRTVVVEITTPLNDS